MKQDTAPTIQPDTPAPCMGYNACMDGVLGLIQPLWFGMAGWRDGNFGGLIRFFIRVCNKGDLAICAGGVNAYGCYTLCWCKIMHLLGWLIES